MLSFNSTSPFKPLGGLDLISLCPSNRKDCMFYVDRIQILIADLVTFVVATFGTPILVNATC